MTVKAPPKRKAPPLRYRVRRRGRGIVRPPALPTAPEVPPVWQPSVASPAVCAQFFVRLAPQDLPAAASGAVSPDHLDTLAAAALWQRALREAGIPKVTLRRHTLGTAAGGDPIFARSQVFAGLCGPPPVALQAAGAALAAWMWEVVSPAAKRPVWAWLAALGQLACGLPPLPRGAGTAPAGPKYLRQCLRLAEPALRAPPESAALSTLLAGLGTAASAQALCTSAGGELLAELAHELTHAYTKALLAAEPRFCGRLVGLQTACRWRVDDWLLEEAMRRFARQPVVVANVQPGADAVHYRLAAGKALSTRDYVASLGWRDEHGQPPPCRGTVDRAQWAGIVGGLGLGN